jgi:hypothetical protein
MALFLNDYVPVQKDLLEDARALYETCFAEAQMMMSELFIECDVLDDKNLSEGFLVSVGLFLAKLFGFIIKVLVVSKLAWVALVAAAAGVVMALGGASKSAANAAAEREKIRKDTDEKISQIHQQRDAIMTAMKKGFDERKAAREKAEQQYEAQMRSIKAELEKLPKSYELAVPEMLGKMSGIASHIRSEMKDAVHYSAEFIENMVRGHRGDKWLETSIEETSDVIRRLKGGFAEVDEAFSNKLDVIYNIKAGGAAEEIRSITEYLDREKTDFELNKQKAEEHIAEIKKMQSTIQQAAHDQKVNQAMLQKMVANISSVLGIANGCANKFFQNAKTVYATGNERVKALAVAINKDTQIRNSLSAKEAELTAQYLDDITKITVSNARPPDRVEKDITPKFDPADKRSELRLESITVESLLA